MVVVIFVLLVLAGARGTDRDDWPRNEWRTSSPEKQGMDSRKLNEIHSYVKQKLPEAKSVPVVRHGNIVLEEYFGGTKDDLRKL
jgi:hypothetical protein